jgi:hypothetical protein
MTPLRRYRISLGLFVAGLVLSGVTAFPLFSEARILAHTFGIEPQETFPTHGFHQWGAWVLYGLRMTYYNYPFIAYGTDWLAFGHFCIAVFFIRPFWKPLESDWVLKCGLICCAAVIPTALIAGHFRGVPLYWSLFDCTFGAVGAIPLNYCLKLSQKLRAHG